MRFLGRALFWLVLLALIVAGVGWFLAGREAGPLIAITSPQGFIGQSGALTLTVDTPATGGLEALVKGSSSEGPRLTRLDAVLEQNGQSMPVLSLDGVTPEELTSTADTPNRITITRPIGKKTQPELANGPAKITITAERPVFFGLRTISSSFATMCRCGSIRRGSRWCRSTTSSISAAPSSWCCGRRRKMSRPACRSATRGIRLSGPAVGLSRSGVARRLLRASPRSGRQHRASPPTRAMPPATRRRRRSSTSRS